MQSGTSYRLVVRRGPQPNQQFLLTRDTVTLGRDITNDIVINDPEVSRHHARLIRTPSGYSYEDLRSTNGSFINRQRLSTPYQLQNGDLLGLGETITLVYEVVGEAAATMVAPSGGAGAPQPMAAAPSAARPAPMPMPADAGEEEEFQPDRNRWIVIGCGALTLLLCCAIVVGVIMIDQTKSWCSIPLIGPLVGCP
jgi:predicted component of type VI protein secretion system